MARKSNEGTGVVVAAVVVWVLGLLGSLAFVGVAIWAIIEIVQWLTTK